MMFVVEDRLLYAGDLIFSGRIPFVGNGDSRGWLQATNRMLALSPAIVVPGHGPVSRDVARDLTLTHDYLVYLRETMGRAVKDLTPFDEAYAKTDWVTLRAAACVRAGKPDQRVGDVPANGAGRARRRELGPFNRPWRDDRVGFNRCRAGRHPRPHRRARVRTSAAGASPRRTSRTQSLPS